MITSTSSSIVKSLDPRFMGDTTGVKVAAVHTCSRGFAVSKLNPFYGYVQEMQ